MCYSRNSPPVALFCLTLAMLIELFLVQAMPVYADDPDFGRPRPHAGRGTTEIQVSGETRQDGVYIQITVRQSAPGGQQPTPRHDEGQGSSTQPVVNSGRGQSGSGGRGGASASSPQIRRTWVDSSGTYYAEGADRRVYGLEPINSGGPFGRPPGSAFDAEQRQAAGTTMEPRVLTVDGQYQGIVWVPRADNPSDVRWGEPPPPGGPPQPPAGNGGSTDPREVALDLLHHIPLPDIVLKANPALGLVNLPGWFWVEGYDGQPFGASRTVTIPPAVGADVPTDVVPADDPGRQGTSFTVHVRVWPAKYEWDFGDGGGQVVLSLGRRYPEESDIKHTYEYSSLRAGGSFPLRLTVEFAAEFRVDGGGPQGLPSIYRTYESTYRVQEIQPVLTGQ